MATIGQNQKVNKLDQLDRRLAGYECTRHIKAYEEFFSLSHPSLTSLPSLLR